MIFLNAGPSRTIKIAILAMGGEGGGVLADWIVGLGEHNGYIAQTTSVPGVAQRTGATIYYVELFPEELASQASKRPILALMPTPGDVDIVLASELMEAGRAVQRGFVTPDRTTLISSTHRVYSIAEKSAMGDGRVDSNELIAHAGKAAKRYVKFDMALAAEANGSVISAVLFGALAGTGVLPFGRAAFEATIERGGVGVKPSLRAFGASYATTQATEEPVESTPGVRPVQWTVQEPKLMHLLERVRLEHPADLHGTVVEGVRRMIDYQDVTYARLYLDRLQALTASVGKTELALLRETARYLALWMSYEDTIRVADLKTRSSRFERVRDEVRATDKQQLAIKEFMHPRIEEICETLPAPIGRWLMKPHAVHRLIRRFTTSGRVITTSSLRGFLLLWSVSRMRGMRRTTLRFKLEDARIKEWLDEVQRAAAHNPLLALELAQCQRLVKGYSDTHARGLANYRRVMNAVKAEGARMAPATLRDLRDAALADEHGKALDKALARHALV